MDSAVALDHRDITHRIGNDPAYLAIIDTARYSADMPDWDYDTLTEKVTAAMNRGKLVAWGTPEDDLLVRLTMTPLNDVSVRSVNASIRVRLITAGRSASRTTRRSRCARSSATPTSRRSRIWNSPFPPAHTTSRSSACSHTSDGDHYVAVFTPATGALSRFAWVAWALRPASVG
jgi:hypothetical protein